MREAARVSRRERARYVLMVIKMVTAVDGWN